jgi:Nif-specific regulatory protein
MLASLTIETGQGSPLVCDLHPDRPVTLGRNRNNTIILLDEHASRWHAEVVPQHGRWYLRDIGTLNGTRLNGERILQPVPLEHGHLITIGNTRLRFSVGSGNGKAAHAVEDCATVLCADDLTALCQFMTAAVEETDPRGLIELALHTARRQTGAVLTGFLGLGTADPLPKMVYPETAQVDVPLSRRLTAAIQTGGRSVLLSSGRTPPTGDSDSLASFQDALCVPLRAAAGPIGALHVYKAGLSFLDREVRFCEVLAGYLANCLYLLRVQRSLEAENCRLRGQRATGDELIGDSPALRQVRQLIAKAAGRPSTVLITGESGVGKELVAVALHRQSPRRGGPLVSVNCAAIAPSLLESELFGHCKGAFSGATGNHPGLFEQADEGTIFLDEVGELSSECQAKLLRVIEGQSFRPVGARAEVRVDVRIVAATNRDLEREVEAGRFRQDLYFRLQVIRIPVPPLREHVEDLPALVEHFLNHFAREGGPRLRLSEGALRRLQEHAWPGNVRQLRSLLESAVALSDKELLEAEDLPQPAGSCQSQPPSLNMEELEAWAIREGLRRSNGNITQAARLVGISRDTLAAKMKRYGLGKDPA